MDSLISYLPPTVDSQVETDVQDMFDCVEPVVSIFEHTIPSLSGLDSLWGMDQLWLLPELSESATFKMPGLSHGSPIMGEQNS